MDAFTPSGGYRGTDGIKRALTLAESTRLGALLREHGFVAACKVALRFAFRLTKGRGNARDVLGRAQLRLTRQGWDPAEVALVKRMLRLVWSEYTHELEESARARFEEDAFLREEAVQRVVQPSGRAHGDPLRAVPMEPAVPSYEKQLEVMDAERASSAKHGYYCDRLGAVIDRFRDAKDKVNQDYVAAMLRGVVDLDEMCLETGHTKDDFYAAQKRRKRAVEQVLENTPPPPAAADDDDDEENA